MDLGCKSLTIRRNGTYKTGKSENFSAEGTDNLLSILKKFSVFVANAIW